MATPFAHALLTLDLEFTSRLKFAIHAGMGILANKLLDHLRSAGAANQNLPAFL